MKSLLLPPLSVLYGAVTRTRLSLYRRGTFHSTKLDRPVISVGNITTGGTGKTPLVEWVARTVANDGKKVCILTRGYGRDNPGRLVVVSDGHSVQATPAEAGDEPFLLATNLAGAAAVISSADRVAAGNEAIKQLGTDCFVLDDGFQHLRLERDLNIVTIDATNPWGGGSLLPYGRLREPLSGLERADCIVITRTDQAGNLDQLRDEIRRHTGDIRIFQSRMQTTRITRLDGSLDAIVPPVAAFCAVGNPRSFFDQVPDELVRETAFPDHHHYSQRDVDSLIDAAKHAGANSLVTTAKDAVKLRSLSFYLPCYVLEIEPRIDNDAELIGLVLSAANQR
ncbi:MAG TPA: tetraacyldisaccharide 4'-kinase [Pyrinomonadaceae bacterium]|nr:tetraacyldisaccharide 4'-kinase [Pyrinomonadaceae bacterium]